ncbi:MAG: ABC transporter ATP-binding protein/permease [Gemmatimonadetes bacterium]|nr:ABC transporter ATP-binding protein/permease [Gemmatimonadota bacterium]NNK63742.1 ABC transporter ATP-binding protein [Gemmatimonadota bacterium]
MTPKEPGRLGKTLALLSPRERVTGGMVLVLLLVQAVLETAGVASVMPFLAVLGNPGLVESNFALAWAYDFGAFENTDDFLFALGIAAFGLIVFTAFFRICTTYAIARWTQMRRFSLGSRLLDVYLRQPYEFFLNRNSADLSKSILSESDLVVGSVLRPAMDTLAYALVALAIVVLLLLTDPTLALIITALLAVGYGLIYASVRGLLGRRGEDRLNANRERFTAATEALGGIKDLKVLGREQAYLWRFNDPAYRLAEHNTLWLALQSAPRYLVEAIGFGGVLALALFLMGTGADLGTILPVLGLYTFAGYRLLPAAQNIYSGVSSLRFGLPSVDELYSDMKDRGATARPVAPADRALGLDRELRFDNVAFRYPGTDEDTLHDMDVAVPARSSLAFVGQTGAGKTTAVDLLLGLLRPTQGQILVDGKPLTDDNLRAWQSSLGYVPQSIYLADAAVRENIAFGVPRGRIDDEAVERAARVANIHDFIMTLPEGYDTEVGERGVRMSGGQRQRVGIARALYHDPPVLVLDEATSALDTATERAIMESVEKLSGHKTIIMIAHRMSTVEGCDRIVLLEDGHAVGVGTFEELRERNPAFRKLATA